MRAWGGGLGGLVSVGRRVGGAGAGAFTPGCSKTHLPGYVSSFEKLSAAGAKVRTRPIVHSSCPLVAGFATSRQG